MASVTLEIEDALGVVTISRPPLNLFTWEMLDELSDVIDQIAAARCAPCCWKRADRTSVPEPMFKPCSQACRTRRGSPPCQTCPAHGTFAGSSNSTIAAVRGMCLDGPAWKSSFAAMSCGPAKPHSLLNWKP